MFLKIRRKTQNNMRNYTRVPNLNWGLWKGCQKMRNKVKPKG